MRVLRYIILLIVLCSTQIFAQSNKNQVLVAYINNFAKYTEWPNETQLDQFRIAVITQNENLKTEFKNYAKDRTVKGKPLLIDFISSEKLAGNYQMVIVLKKELYAIDKILQFVKGKPILLVTEEFNDKRKLMINLFQTSDDKLEFEINKANVIIQGLKIDPEILLAGGTEIDVATLYRESQRDLQNLQNSIITMEDSLQELRQKVDQSLILIQKQENELTIYDKLLDKKSAEIDSIQKVFLKQKKHLESQKYSIEHKNNILNNQGSKISDQWKELNTQNDMLRLKQNEIEYLNREIDSKNKVLGSQSEQITRQKRILIFIVSISILIVVLIITVFISYRNNKAKGRLLIQKNHEIADKLIEVEQLNAKLKRSDQYKSIFLASMSHELRTPLNSIIGYTGIILMGMTGDLNEEQQKQLLKVKNNANHLLSLINDILDISKIEAGKVELSVEEFKLADVTDEVIEALRPLAQEKNIDLLSNVNKYLLVNTDKRRLKQVVLNIISNAVKYSEKGSIDVFTEYINEFRFRLTVIDTGIGISEEEMARLFQPFQQIDTSLTRKNSGTGLGLYLCRKLMSLLGGHIDVRSTLGEGSKFFIEMPIKLENYKE